MRRQHQVAVITLILLLFGLNAINFALTTDLYARIVTNGVSNGIELEFEGFEFSTNVRVSIEVELWNPNPFPVVIHTSNQNLFYPGIEILFENQTLSYGVMQIFLPMTNTHYIKPGLSHENYGYELTISGVNVSSLPYGDYVFWGEISARLNIIKSYKTYLQVSSSGNFFEFETFPSDWGYFRIITSDWGFFIFTCFQIFIVSTGFLMNKKKKVTKT